MNTPLVCSSCNRGDRLYQEVTVTSEADCDVDVSLGKDGKPELDLGSVNDLGINRDVEPESNMGCSRCNKSWWPPEKGLTAEVQDFRCDECGWWGRQDWLHSHESPDCEGELVGERAPLVPPQAEALVAA